jgi:hypothetical protein
MVSEKEERIKQRVAALYGNGQEPGRFVTDPIDADMLKSEDPFALMEALTNRVLDPGFRASASPKVKAAFKGVMNYVRQNMMDQRASGRMDENLDAEATVARQMEEALDAVEQDPSNFDGLFQVDGLPLGAV